MGRQFVSLKWFRDTCLPQKGFAWGAAPEERYKVLTDAIDRRWILTSRIPNPKNPQFPVTAIRVNRPLDEVRTILDENAKASSPFAPISIRATATTGYAAQVDLGTRHQRSREVIRPRAGHRADDPARQPGAGSFARGSKFGSRGVRSLWQRERATCSGGGYDEPLPGYSGAACQREVMNGSRRHPLRAYDAIQLAGCLALGSRMTERPSFVCSDHRLLRAAEGEGFTALDPAAEP